MLAPVALFVYARPEHTQRTVEALLKNLLAEETDVIVFSDAAKGAEKEQAVAAVREYVSGVKGFKSLTVHYRPHNYGLAKSIIDGVSEVVREHGRVIVLEDDLVTSRYFLTYMNDGLKHFADDERVISLHGYMYPVKRPLPEAFFLPGADCWGWATWARGWALFNPDGQYLLDELRQRGLQKAFDFNGSYPYSGMLEGQIAGSNNSWAIRWYASAFLAGKLTLYPGRSLVQNIGNDDSGTHCGTTTALDVAVSESPIGLDGIDVEPSQDALDAVEEFFRSNQFALRTVLSNVLTYTMMTNVKATVKQWMPPVMVRAMTRLLRVGGYALRGFIVRRMR